MACTHGLGLAFGLVMLYALIPKKPRCKRKCSQISMPLSGVTKNFAYFDEVSHSANVQQFKSLFQSHGYVKHQGQYGEFTLGGTVSGRCSSTHSHMQDLPRLYR